MNWNNAGEFFAMGGYAIYVWGSFAVTAVALALETWTVRRRHAAILYSLKHGVATPGDAQ